MVKHRGYTAERCTRENKINTMKKIQQSYQKEALKASSNFYLTLVSIVDSLALSFFLAEVKGELLFGDHADLIYWLKCLAFIQIIIMVWYEYMVGTLIFQWV